MPNPENGEYACKFTELDRRLLDGLLASSMKHSAECLDKDLLAYAEKYRRYLPDALLETIIKIIEKENAVNPSLSPATAKGFIAGAILGSHVAYGVIRNNMRQWIDFQNYLGESLEAIFRYGVGNRRLEDFFDPPDARLTTLIFENFNPEVLTLKTHRIDDDIFMIDVATYFVSTAEVVYVTDDQVRVGQADEVDMLAQAKSILDCSVLEVRHLVQEQPGLPDQPPQG